MKALWIYLDITAKVTHSAMIGKPFDSTSLPLDKLTTANRHVFDLILLEGELREGAWRLLKEEVNKSLRQTIPSKGGSGRTRSHDLYWVSAGNLDGF